MIIGLGHRSGHGKDTVATYMKEWLATMCPEKTVIVQSWAAKLKEMCYDLYKQYGMMDQAFYDTPEGRLLRNVSLPVICKTPVELWVDMGEGIRDCVYEHTWRDYVRDNIKADVIICPDTRKPTELDICNVKIKVTNPRIPNRVGKSIDHELAHYDGWHHEIINDLGYSELRGKANNLCMKLFFPRGYNFHVDFKGTIQEYD
jgi:hypothetical protein